MFFNLTALLELSEVLPSSLAVTTVLMDPWTCSKRLLLFDGMRRRFHLVVLPVPALPFSRVQVGSLHSVRSLHRSSNKHIPPHSRGCRLKRERSATKTFEAIVVMTRRDRIKSGEGMLVFESIFNVLGHVRERFRLPRFQRRGSACERV